MLKKTINYTDFNGNNRSEDLYFNLSEAELVDIQTSSENGIQEDLQKALDDNDVRAVLEFIKMIIVKAYGEKSSDGRFFRKSDEITNDFLASAFYSDLLLALFEDDGKPGVEFITGLMPADLVRRAQAKIDGENVSIRPDLQDHLPKAKADTNSEDLSQQKAEFDAVEEAERKQFDEWRRSQRAQVAPRVIPREEIPGIYDPGAPGSTKAPNEY